MKNTRNQTNLVDDKSVGCVWRRMGRTGCLSWKIILMSCVHHAKSYLMLKLFRRDMTGGREACKMIGFGDACKMMLISEER